MPSPKIIAASSVGNLLEWYNFYLFGSMASVIAPHFFPDSSPGTALLFILAIYATGFVARPFGALVFGRLGDLAGRKNTFLLTLTIMGASTFAIGLVPGYTTIGVAAPLIVLLLRLLQGFALGGESGGAAIYVAEQSPANRRGYHTAWITATTTLGLLLALGAILVSRYALDPDRAVSIEKFNAWGWRIPFLLSCILVAIAAYLRGKMQESPLFSRLKTAGGLAVNPLKESLTRKANLKIVLLTLFGATMGQGIVLYTGQCYVQSFLEKTCNIDFDQSKSTLLIAILLATPFVLIFGSWSDRIGRKWIILCGMLLAILSWSFLFHRLATTAETGGRVELTDQKEIQSTVAFIGKSRDLARTTSTYYHYQDGMQVMETKQDTVFADGRISTRPKTTISKTLNTADFWKIVAILFALVFCPTVVNGPIAAFLVERFPTRIRYTSVSLTFHLGGVFGGLVPLAGLWYPIGFTAICLVIGALFLPGGNRATSQVALEDI